MKVGKKKLEFTKKNIDSMGNLDEINIDDYTDYDNIKNPFNFRSWWNTLIAASDAPYTIRTKIYEKAVCYLPGSYKLWYHYLKEARDYIKKYPVQDKRFEIINELHERSLIFMNKMPRIWIDYCTFLIDQRLITKTRHCFDNALKSLPVTQHDKLWELYIKWAESLPLSQTAILVYKRYLRLNPDGREDFINYLISIKKFDEAMLNIIEVLNDNLFHSKKGKSKFELWLLLCEIISKYPDKVKNFDCEGIIRHGLKKYTDEVGRLWVALANYYIRQGLFEKARDVFEEALSKILTARDFGIVFNSYLKFEETLINNMIEENEEEKEKKMIEEKFEKLVNETFSNLIIGEEKNNMIVDSDWEQSKESDNLGLNMKLFRLENLIERRPFLLSDALLRQNPNNIYEWLNRVKICKGDKELMIKTYEKALATVDNIKAYGRPELLYINFAKFYDEQGLLEKANEVFYRGTQSEFKSIEQITNIWCEWVEMHLLNHNYIDAYVIVKKGCTTCKTRGDDDKSYLRNFVSGSLSLKLWSFYIDLEEQLGVFENVKAIYQRIIDLKISNPKIIMNYCDYLEKNLHYEEAFRVYEQALSVFSWPHVYDLWIIYLSKFVDRYKGDKLERARDLFEQVISSATKDKVKIFYYMYAELEEEYGLLNHAIRILDKGCNDVPKEEKPEIYSVLIAKTASFFGITKTRNVFSRALEALDPDQILDIGLKFAAIERKLGEIDRSRAILVHLSQFCDPTKADNIENFWKIWEEFELYHGNEDTYKEMLRTKRSVASRYSLNAPLFVVENKLPI